MKRLLIICIFLIPQITFANIVITEVMYDAEGSDSGAEWIEILNSGDTDVSIGDWYFYENNTHHKLIPENFEILAAGAYAIIVQDIEKAQSILGQKKFIKSSFSLSNEGESLTMSNPEKKLGKVFNYTINDGATGNGLSLQLIDGVITESKPTPGEKNILVENSSTDDSQENTEGKVISKNKSMLNQNYYLGNIDIPDQILENSPLHIDAYVTHIKDNRKTEKIKGVYFLNFGDGSFIESETRINDYHIYKNPGNYILVLEYYTSALAKESNQEPNLIFQKTIKVQKPELKIAGVNQEGGIVLENELEQNINLEYWNLNLKDKTYTFPKYTYIKSGDSLTISKEVHGIFPITDNSWINLRNEKNNTIYSYSKNKTGIEKLSNTSRAIQQIKTINENISETPLDKEVLMGDAPSINQRYLDEYPNKKRANFNNSQYEGVYNNSEEEDSKIPVNIAFTAALGAIIVGIFRVRKIRNLEGNKGDELDLGDIELIE